MPAHLYLHAVKLLENDGAIGETFVPLAWALRVAFFRDLVDISKREHLDMIAERHGVPIDGVTHFLESGRAHAELHHDARLQQAYDVQVIPKVLIIDSYRRHPKAFG